MMDKRKAWEEMLDEQLEELNAKIVLFRPSRDRYAIDGSRKNLKGGAEKAMAEGNSFFHSTASRFQ